MVFACAIGFLSSIVVLIVLARLGLAKFMGYPAFLDVAVTLALAWLLHGTYVGMVAAIIGGLIFSLAITIIRSFYGYARLKRVGYTLKWVYHAPTPLKTRLNAVLINHPMAIWQWAIPVGLIILVVL